LVSLRPTPPPAPASPPPSLGAGAPGFSYSRSHMEPIKRTATLSSNIRVQHEPADGGDAASGTIGAHPIHLIEKILGYFSPLDSVRLAVVCKSWAAAVSERLARPTPHLFALKLANVHSQSPFRFMLPPEEERRHRGAIYSLPVNEEGSPSLVAPARLPSAVRDPKGMNFKLSGALPCGLLSFAVGNRVFLVNPLTGAFQSDMYAPFGTGAKVRTVAGANAIFDHDYSERNVLLSWCTEEWRQRKLLSQEFKNIYLMAYADGVFYALEFRGCAYSVDTRVPPPWRLKKLRAPSILEQYTLIRGRFLCYSHLLESEGSVLFVGPVLAPRQPTCRDTIGGFEVYRLDVEVSRWVKVERLAAERALFVSEQSSFTVRASEVPGCMSNCIYFVGEVDEYSYVTWGVYSMEERKVLFQRPVGGSWGRYAAARWFLPAVVIPFADARAHCTLRRKDKNLSSSGTFD
uniref:F-box domain-containing protein n=1 Tax=Aegilops tauschii subsp. strangulata TaxID=200361 RepID=A0A453MWE0_AEGTS